jgi:hypothetical protein
MSFERGHVAGDAVGGHDLAQKAAHDFAAARFGEGVGELDLGGLGQGSDLRKDGAIIGEPTAVCR